MFRLRFNYKPSLELILCDTHTFAAGVELYIRGIHTVQLDAHTLEFETAQLQLFAMLLLSDSSVYTVSAVSAVEA
jgi:hypothetical protein